MSISATGSISIQVPLDKSTTKATYLLTDDSGYRFEIDVASGKDEQAEYKTFPWKAEVLISTGYHYATDLSAMRNVLTQARQLVRMLEAALDADESVGDK